MSFLARASSFLPTSSWLPFEFRVVPALPFVVCRAPSSPSRVRPSASFRLRHVRGRPAFLAEGLVTVKCSTRDGPLHVTLSGRKTREGGGKQRNTKRKQTTAVLSQIG